MPRKKSFFKPFLSSLKQHRVAIIVSFILAIIASALNVIGPKILGQMTTLAAESYAATQTIDLQPIAQKAHLLIIIYVTSSLLIYIQSLVMNILTARYTKKLRSEILEKINHLPVSYLDKHQYGDILSRMSNDVDIISQGLSEQAISLISNFITVVGILIMMLTISVPLSIIALITVPLSMLFVGTIAKKSQKLFISSRETLGRLNNHIEEDYSGVLVIKSCSHEDDSLKDFCKVNRKLYEDSWKASFLSRLSFPIVHVITNLGYAAICIVGGLLAIGGRISIGDVQAFVQYTSQFNRPISSTAELLSSIQLTLAAIQRVFEFLAEPEETELVKNKKQQKHVVGNVVFNDVCFSYNKDKPTIKHFSANIPAGSQVAIVGPTGAGKTTMINLLMRFYDPDSGTISIDGIPTTEMSRADVRKMFGMVLQDTWLFSGTIEENLRYGKTSATTEEIHKAAKASNVNHVIEALPDSYQTKISEDSDNVSAGEKQLLTIARAMVANPPMMILDEATSNVDTRTEKLIQSAFEKLTKGRTSFVIAHRLSTIRNADIIIVMRDGNVVETGNHDELLAKNGFYAELYNSQFADK